MNTILRLSFLFLLLPFFADAQVSCDPVFPSADDDVTIYYDATLGNGALTGVSPVYAHMGVITSASTTPSDWKYVATTWGIADPKGLMTPDGPNRWKKSFNIRSFFNIPAQETVLQLALVFRNANGSLVGRASDGGDIFYNVYPAGGALFTLLIEPEASLQLVDAGAEIPVRAAASLSSEIRLFDNGSLVLESDGKSLDTSIVAGSAGLHRVDVVFATASEQDTQRFAYLVPALLPDADPPAGTREGITQIDDQTLRLALYAPGKQNVFVSGDFNDWAPGADFQMRRSIDQSTWWLDITGLTPGATYRFQYLVDGAIRIADPYSDQILDPWNDGFIASMTYPDLPPYPMGKTNGIVSVVTLSPPAYAWQHDDYARPDKARLTIYELLLRDFLALQNYGTLTDTLDYLQRLGVNAIELMPVNEFDGNLSWGYNPGYHHALDKYYGTPEAFKRFVDACHERGIAVIVDVVFNHATGLSPLAQLYWDAANNRPAPDNPWLNPTPRHDFNVFNDFNHESPATRRYVKRCLQRWIEEYHIDGYRFDLSKGFTQKNTIGNVGAWGQYDAARVAVLKEYADHMWSTDPGSYVILEHFADNAEEKELAAYGMLLWGKMWGPYKDIALGLASGQTADLSGVSHQQRGWSQPHLIGYMESHDEERIVYECLTYGNASASHNVRTLPVALRRVEMLANLLFTVPGPKMFWQFGELGYDYSINWCTDGSINNGCRTGEKPVRWDYLQDPVRRRLHDVYAALLQLRLQQPLFGTDDFTLNLSGGPVRSMILRGADLNAVVVANIGTGSISAPAVFPHDGVWYDYYTGQTVTLPAGATTLAIPLEAAGYRLFLDKSVPLPPGIRFDTAPPDGGGDALSALSVRPNPVQSALGLRFTLGAANDVTVRVFDAGGRLAYEQVYRDLDAGEQVLEIPANGWANGVYTVQIREKGGKTRTERFVKLP